MYPTNRLQFVRQLRQAGWLVCFDYIPPRKMAFVGAVNFDGDLTWNRNGFGSNFNVRDEEDGH